MPNTWHEVIDIPRVCLSVGQFTENLLSYTLLIFPWFPVISGEFCHQTRRSLNLKSQLWLSALSPHSQRGRLAKFAGWRSPISGAFMFIMYLGKAMFSNLMAQLQWLPFLCHVDLLLNRDPYLSLKDLILFLISVNYIFFSKVLEMVIFQGPALGGGQ
jgi:hypothetical protein